MHRRPSWLRRSPSFLPRYPDIHVEINNDYNLVDIVTERYDAGVRLGEQVAQDMIAVRVGPDFGMVVVGAPSYFKQRAKPLVPHDLTVHACIALRLPTSGGLWSWPFAKDGRELKVRVEGPLVFNTITLMIDMALAGLGLAYVPEDQVRDYLKKGRLVQVLCRLVSPFLGVPSLLSQPPAAHAGLRVAG